MVFPNSTKLKNGDIIGVDIGINLKGYFSDRAMTYAVGSVDEDAQLLLKVTEESLYKAIDAAVAGNRIKDIGKAVTSHVKHYDFSVVYDFCGHGVGPCCS